MPPLNLGVGFYDARRVPRLIDIRPERLRRWIRGTTGRRGTQVAPVIDRDLPELDGSIPLTFLDLVEIRMVKAFLDAGVGLATIRRAAETAVEMFASKHPFCLQRLQTDGRSVFAKVHELHPDGVDGESSLPLLDLAKRQAAIKEVMDPLMKKEIVYLGDVASEWWPRGKDQGVVLNPMLSFGAPVIAGCGVPTEILAAAFKAEGGYEAAAQWHGVDVDAVRQAVAFERWLNPS